MRAGLASAILVLAVGASGCASPREAALDRLANDLARVRAAPAEQHVDAEPNLDPGVFVGTPRSQIVGKLGPGQQCWHPEPLDGAYTCESYDFFHLPEDWAGGGTVLQLYYDGYGQCVRARWIATE